MRAPVQKWRPEDWIETTYGYSPGSTGIPKVLDDLPNRPWAWSWFMKSPWFLSAFPRPPKQDISILILVLVPADPDIPFWNLSSLSVRFPSRVFGKSVLSSGTSMDDIELLSGKIVELEYDDDFPGFRRFLPKFKSTVANKNNVKIHTVAVLGIHISTITPDKKKETRLKNRRKWRTRFNSHEWINGFENLWW